MDNEIPLGDEQEATMVVRKKRCSMVPNALKVTFKREITIFGEEDVSKAIREAQAQLAQDVDESLASGGFSKLFDVKVSQVK